MAITISGDTNTISGLANGGLPDGCILDADINGMAASKLTGALPAISGASLTGVGITMADRWHLTGNFNLSSASTYYTITGTWAKSTTSSHGFFGSIGSAMTESSGVFTFPSTGIYYIVYDCITGTSNDQLNMWSYIGIGADASATTYASVKASSGDSATMNTSTGSGIVDITNTSTQKCILRGYAANTGCYVSGNSEGERTAVTFIRLGDT